jgi:hypothetical protein
LVSKLLAAVHFLLEEIQAFLELGFASGGQVSLLAIPAELCA